MTSKKETSEKEKELIEKAARKIVDSQWEFPTMFLLQTVKPLVWIGGELGYFFLAPLLPLLEDKGYDFLDTFEKRENVELLIKAVERLHMEREEEKKEKERTQGQSLWDKLRKRSPRANYTKEKLS
jgi:hypothetical protein